MVTYSYAYNGPTDKIARAMGKALPISMRASMEICRYLRQKPLNRAKQILNDAINMKKPIPFKRFTEGAGHQSGFGPAKYPIKACAKILELLESAEANAHNKGLSKDLKIAHIITQKAPKAFHYGRQIRRKMKRTHLEVVLAEYVPVQKKTKNKPAKSEEK